MIRATEHIIDIIMEMNFVFVDYRIIILSLQYSLYIKYAYKHSEYDYTF
jgi:hypothetical protein